MSAPTPFARQTSFALFTSENPGVAHSGVDLDVEFDAVKIALDETQSNLALIQDADGQLARGSVGRAQFDSSVTLGFEAPSAWAADTVYEADLSTVFYASKFYIATSDHTSGDTFDSTKWEEIADFTLQNTLGDGDVTTPKLADLAVTEAKLAAQAVTTAKVDTGAITAPKLGALAVTTAKIDANAVTAAKVDSSVWGTGDIKLTLKTAADAGWRMFDDGTIGDASSSATYANAAAEALFTLMFDNFVDANAAITTSVGGATTRSAQTNAATAWAAHCRIALPKVLGRAIAIAGSGSGLTSRALGVAVGAESHTLTVDELPVITPAGTNSPPDPRINGSDVPAYAGTALPGVTTGGATTVAGSAGELTITTPVFTGTPFGGDDAHNNVQPTAFLNAMVKL